MLVVKPHFVTIASVTQPASDARVMGNPVAGSPSPSVSCLVAPLAPAEAYHLFGVALIDPRKVYMEVADAVAYASPNAMIVFNGDQFWQKGDAEIHRNGDSADCAIVYCSRNQYPF